MVLADRIRRALPGRGFAMRVWSRSRWFSSWCSSVWDVAGCEVARAEGRRKLVLLVSPRRNSLFFSPTDPHIPSLPP